LLLCGVECEVSSEPSRKDLKRFPAGYIDSVFVVPDGSALYFIHSPASTKDILTGNPHAKPVSEFLPGHTGRGGKYWWNTDIYVSHRNPDGTWGLPVNLGYPINTEHMECGPWVNEEQTVLIFTRESVGEPELSGTYICFRESKDQPWGEPKRLPGVLGEYGKYGYHDFHMTENGDLYFWSKSSGNGVLYWAKRTGEFEWSSPEVLKPFQSEKDETQPWLNGEGTRIYFNRRGEDGNTILMMSERDGDEEEWSEPKIVETRGFEDSNGYSLWGEPSFTESGEMFFVRFNTAYPDWQAEILVSKRAEDGGYELPLKVVFSEE